MATPVAPPRSPGFGQRCLSPTPPRTPAPRHPKSTYRSLFLLLGRVPQTKPLSVKPCQSTVPPHTHTHLERGVLAEWPAPRAPASTCCAWVHNLTWSVHNLTWSVHNLTWSVHNLTWSVHNLTWSARVPQRCDRAGKHAGGGDRTAGGPDVVGVSERNEGSRC